MAIPVALCAHKDAVYEHGVLSLTIPVAAEANPRKIQIESGSSQPQQIGQSQQSTQSQSTGESSSQ